MRACARHGKKRSLLENEYFQPNPCNLGLLSRVYDTCAMDTDYTLLYICICICNLPSYEFHSMYVSKYQR